MIGDSGMRNSQRRGVSGRRRWKLNDSGMNEKLKRGWLK